MESTEQTNPPEMPVHIKNATAVAQDLSQTVEDTWVKSMKRIDTLLGLPDKGNLTPEQDGMLRDSIGLLCEYLMGTCVAVMTHYVNKEPVFEKYLKDMMGDQFNRLRNMPKEKLRVADQN